MRYELRALSLGEILDQGIKLVRDKFGILMAIMALTIVPSQIVISLFANKFQPVPGQPTPPAQIGSLLPYLAIVYGFLLVILPLANAAVVYTAARTFLGQQTSLGESFGHALRRLPALIWTSILMGLAIMGGFILLVIPGILCSLWFMLAQQVAVLEPISGGPALSRSKALMKGNIGTGIVLGIVLWVINFGLGMVSGLLPHPFNAISAGVMGGVTTLISTCTFVVFYFSCRCKLDNFDLEVLANEIGEAEAEAEDASEQDE